MGYFFLYFLQLIKTKIEFCKVFFYPLVFSRKNSKQILARVIVELQLRAYNVVLLKNQSCFAVVAG